MAHRTIALTTELREPTNYNPPATCSIFALWPPPPAAAPRQGWGRPRAAPFPSPSGRCPALWATGPVGRHTAPEDCGAQTQEIAVAAAPKVSGKGAGALLRAHVPTHAWRLQCQHTRRSAKTEAANEDEQSIDNAILDGPCEQYAHPRT